MNMYGKAYMSDAIVTTLITATPGILWVLFAATVFFVLRRPLVQQLNRLRAANTIIGSFDFEVALELVERAADSQDGRTTSGVRRDAPSPADRRAVATRLEYAAPILDGVRILWIDDHPEHNRSLIRVFERAGMSVRTALSTDDGLAEARLGKTDLIITDMVRHGNSAAGFDLVDRLAAKGIDIRVILYTLDFDPLRGVHPGIFGYTTTYDELINLVVDAIERLRFAEPDGGRTRSLPRQIAPN